MDEYIDILNEHGKKTGETCLKSEAHKKGLFHASAHVWIFDKNKNVLIQQRAINKETFPGLWDISVAGHISAGETPLISAIREVEEEIGISVVKNQLHLIGTFKKKVEHHSNFIDYELHYIYMCEMELHINSIKIQQDEVLTVKIVPLKDIKIKVLAKNNNFVPHETEYFQLVFNAIESFNEKP
jgi:isopentenyldiphosphate isomerase